MRPLIQRPSTASRSVGSATPVRLPSTTPAPKARPRSKNHLIEVVGRVFQQTAHRWWSTLADDSEDRTLEAENVIRLVRLGRFVRRWLRFLKVRRLYRLRRVRRLNYSAGSVLLGRSRRFPMSRHAGACLRFWLLRWRKKRLMAIRVQKDRSWALILDRSRSWKRYKLLRPIFRQWHSHVHGHCVRRNAIIAKRKTVTVTRQFNVLRASVVFWRVSTHAVRCVLRACFARLEQFSWEERARRRLPGLIGAWSRLWLREGFLRWARRTRWPTAIALASTAALSRGLRALRCAAGLRQRARGYEYRSEQLILVVSTKAWRRNVEGWVVHRTGCGRAQESFFNRRGLSGLGKWQVRSDQLQQGRAQYETASTYFARRSLWCAMLDLRQAAAGAGSRGAAGRVWLRNACMFEPPRRGSMATAEDCSPPSPPGHFSFRSAPPSKKWVELLHVNKCATSRGLLLSWAWSRRQGLLLGMRRWTSAWRRGRRVGACSQLFALSGRSLRSCVRRWLRYCAFSQAARTLSTLAGHEHLSKKWGRWRRTCAAAAEATQKLRVGREFHACRAVPWAWRRWRRRHNHGLVLRRLVWFASCRRAVRRWLRRTGAGAEFHQALGHSRGLAEQSLLYHRAQLRFEMSAPRSALKHWFSYKHRRQRLRHAFRLFRRLHPIPRCSSATVILKQWQVNAQAHKRLRQIVRLAGRQRRGGELLTAWRQWRDTWTYVCAVRPWKLRLALRRWVRWLGWRHTAFGLLQRFVAARALRKFIPPYEREESTGLPLLPCRLPSRPRLAWLDSRQRHTGWEASCSSLGMHQAVRAVLVSTGFRGFSRRCFLRRVVAQWRSATLEWRQEGARHAIGIAFSTRRAACLARALPQVAAMGRLALLNRCVRRWVALVSATNTKSRQVGLASMLHRALAHWQQVAEKRLRDRMARTIPTGRDVASRLRLGSLGNREPLAPRTPNTKRVEHLLQYQLQLQQQQQQQQQQQ